MLEAVRLWDWQNSTHKFHAKNTLLHYTLGSTLLRGGLDDIDVPAILRSAAKEDVHISDKRAAPYRLVPVSDTRELRYSYTPEADADTSGVYYPIHLDTPVGFVLDYKGRPQAVAAVTASGDDTIMIRQLQGVRGKVYAPEERPGAHAPGLARVYG